MLIICDVDNVLADDAWRRSFIRHNNPDLHARYRDYHMSSVMDNSRNHDLICVRGARVVLLTAMPE